MQTLALMALAFACGLFVMIVPNIIALSGISVVAIMSIGFMSRLDNFTAIETFGLMALFLTVFQGTFFWAHLCVALGLKSDFLRNFGHTRKSRSRPLT